MEWFETSRKWFLLVSCFFVATLTSCNARIKNVDSNKKCGGGNSQLRCYKCDSQSDPRCGAVGVNFTVPHYEHVLCADGILSCHTLKISSNDTVKYVRGCAAYNPVKQGCRLLATETGGIIKECFCNKHVCNASPRLSSAAGCWAFIAAVLLQLVVRLQ